MKPVRLTNEYGESIEVKWDADGNIMVRHSDIDKKRFGRLHEYSKRARIPQCADSMKNGGVNPDDPIVKKLLGKMGAYVVIGRRTALINAEETAMILEAVKQHGGIVPNWSSI